jgi:signal transduction histidine kinase
MKSRLGQRILAPTLTIIAIGLVTTLVVTYLGARQAAFQESTRRLQRETELAGALIDNWIQAQLLDLRLWAEEESLLSFVQRPEYVNLTTGNQVHRFLNTQQLGHPYYEGIFLANRQGQVLAYSTMHITPVARILLHDRPYFQEALAGRQVISPLVLSKTTANQVFVITAPLKVGKEIIGVLGGVVDFAAFSTLFLRNYQSHGAETAFLCTNKGIILTGSQPLDKDSPIRVQIGAVMTGKPRHQGVARTTNPQLLITTHPLQHTNWSFVLVQSVDSLLSPLTRAGQMSALVGLVLLAGIFLLVVFLHHRLITTRLRIMFQGINRVQQGDLGCRIVQLPGKTDEISDLVDAFNQMIGQLEGNIALLNREIQMRKDSEHRLAYHQQHLELTIAERSRELEAAIIQRQQVEERLNRSEKLEMIGTLAGGVAHNLNNILSGIVTYPDLLLLTLADDSPLAKPLQTIKRSGERAAAIVQDLLTLSGHRGLKKKLVLVHDLLGELPDRPEWKKLRERSPHIEFQCDRAAELPPIMGAPESLIQALIHLASNGAAILGPEPGRISLSATYRLLQAPLQAYEQIAAGAYAVIEVQTIGRGLAADDLARIFEPFYTQKKLKLKGTGLEMAVVLGIVKDHGGFVDCDGAPGQGVRFSLFFHLAADPEKPSALAPEPAPEGHDLAPNGPISTQKQ